MSRPIQSAVAALQLPDVIVGLQEAGTKVGGAVSEILARDGAAESWLQRVILREVANRARTRGPEYWEAQFPGLSPQERAEARIGRMLARCTAASIAAAATATTAELMPIVTDGTFSPIAIPLGVVSVGAEMLYTTAMPIDLAFDLASIYGVPLAPDDVGEISTLLAASLGVALDGGTAEEASSTTGNGKVGRVLGLMQRDDFANQIGTALLQRSVARNVVPIASVIVSAAWNQLMLRRFARQVHAAVRRRLGIVRACRDVRLGDPVAARTMLDGAWLIATADGEVGHQEALALATLIESLGVSEQIDVDDASFADDEEAWFTRLPQLADAVHPILIRVLVMVAGASGSLGVPERRFLHRLGATLHRQLDFATIERFVAQLREGETQQAGALEFAFAG